MALLIGVPLCLEIFRSVYSRGGGGGGGGGAAGGGGGGGGAGGGRSAVF
eukprot:SAG31_NODE_5109_length_2739_cov_2.238636_1_plen_48_part_10